MPKPFWFGADVGREIGIMNGRMLAIGLMLAGTGCIPASNPGLSTSAQSGARCFWPSSVTGFSDAGADRALVKVGQRETWELTLSPGCPDVNWAMRIGIASRGGDRACEGRPAHLLVPSASGALQRCSVRSVRKLSDAEAIAAQGMRSPR